jgi:hypothetical protein
MRNDSARSEKYFRKEFICPRSRFLHKQAARRAPQAIESFANH